MTDTHDNGTEREGQEAGKHTAGPWPLSATGDGKRYIVGDGLVEGPGGYEVAEVYADDCDPDEAKANGHLIAAAPDMLEALRRYLPILEALEETGRWDEHAYGTGIATANAYRATIAKAEGRS